MMTTGSAGAHTHAYTGIPGPIGPQGIPGPAGPQGIPGPSGGSGGGDPIHVKDFLATTDADYTAAVRRAIAAAPPPVGGIGGAIIQFPTGPCAVSGTITIPKGYGLTLQGAGSGSSQLRGWVSGGPTLSTFYDGTGNVVTLGLNIRDLMVYNICATGGPLSTALRLCQAGDVYVSGCGYSTLAAAPAVDCDAGYQLYFLNCGFAGASPQAWGFQSGSRALGSVNALSLVNCTVNDSLGGFALHAAHGFLIEGCHIEQLAGGTGKHGILLDSCEGGTIVGNYIESIPGPGYGIATITYQADAPNGVVIGGNYITNCAVGCIDLSTANSFTVLSNTLRVGNLNPNPTGITGAPASAGHFIAPQGFPNWGSGVKVGP